jgi:hypothetical protein
MGADGFIINPSESVDFSIRCYSCGGDINAESHESCVNDDGELPVDIEISNYRDR